MDKNAYVLRLGQRLPKAIQQNVVGIGWAHAPDLLQHPQWDALKTSLRQAYPAMYEGNERSLGNGAGSVWRFLFEMKTGDLVLVPCDEGFHLAEVVSDAYFEPAGVSDDFAWRRKIVWRKAGAIPRSHASNELQKRLKVRNTCASATDLLNDICKAEAAKGPVSFNSTALSGVHEAVSKALKSSLNDRQLEELVRSLALASGATSAEVLPKRGPVGDADVKAVYDLRIGGAHMEAKIQVLYQVKHHQGVSDAYGIQQLIDRMDVMGGEAVKGCFVTTAPAVTAEAQTLAEANDILVVKERELIDWILSVGLGSSLGERD
ncbi:MAG: hypothetical protein DI628_01375 [Blastochloris viridis]|uniref:Restriction endonuclease type IV Mrr domain-containing protein n=1 Tax=Blastochloris viridis TaxID=1079 RepID=A0A6N4R3A5_BLAVI|nr:MAG: hypothetical protein DI628_01375 [Blastochloris viridis]